MNYQGTFYRALHKRVRKIKEKGGCCNCCGKRKKLDLALKKGKKYTDNPDDYLYLCRVCHFKYDEVGRKSGNTQRGKQKNRKKGESGYSGVSWQKDKKRWRIYASVNRKQIFGGVTHSLKKAIEIRKKLIKKVYLQ